MSSLAVLCDFPEEGWASMDLAAEMLLSHGAEAAAVDARLPTPVKSAPRFRRRLQRVSVSSRARNADRLLNRLWDYPRHARAIASDHDVFHVVDHSYAQLLLELPRGRAGVFCHDLDTFRSVLEPHRERRPRWFRAMAGRILRGFGRAAVVFHSTGAVRDEILRHGLVEPSRLVACPLGIAAEFVPGDDAQAEQDRRILPADMAQHRYVLHVGTCIPRKRIDVLLDVFAAVSASRADLRLLQVGGSFTPPQRDRIAALQVGDRVLQVRGVGRGFLAAAYRQSAAVLLTSEAEGFGLPVIEALACGASVIASDLPVLREVGGGATLHAPVGDVAAWSATLGGLLDGTVSPPTRAARLSRASQFSWSRHASIILDSYARLARGQAPAGNA